MNWYSNFSFFIFRSFSSCATKILYESNCRSTCVSKKGTVLCEVWVCLWVFIFFYMWNKAAVLRLGSTLGVTFRSGLSALITPHLLSAWPRSPAAFPGLHTPMTCSLTLWPFGKRWAPLHLQINTVRCTYPPAYSPRDQTPSFFVLETLLCFSQQQNPAYNNLQTLFGCWKGMAPFS